jgi:hypothetical protein
VSDERRMWTHRTWLSVTAAVVGLLLFGSAVVMIGHNRAAPTDAGALPAPATSAAPTAGLPRPTFSSIPSRATHVTGTSAPSPMVQRSPAHSGSVAAMSVAAGQPAALHLPTLQISAVVDPVDSLHGILEVPDDISHVGWWQRSARPGSSTGSMVIDGHIDSAAAGAGALFHLAALSPGDPITLSTTTGAVITYRVQARRIYVKARGLPADLFTQTGPARLVIISCGGTFDAAHRSYDDNIVIFATAQTN